MASRSRSAWRRSSSDRPPSGDLAARTPDRLLNQWSKIMHATDVAIIGGGQAGLAMSRCLFDRGIDHLVFERGEIGCRWQSHAWDSLRLLTPNWMNVLPRAPFEGNDPDGFM